MKVSWSVKGKRTESSKKDGCFQPLHRRTRSYTTPCASTDWHDYTANMRSTMMAVICLLESFHMSDKRSSSCGLQRFGFLAA
jgi:hypothetical protein